MTVTSAVAPAGLFQDPSDVCLSGEDGIIFIGAVQTANRIFRFSKSTTALMLGPGPASASGGSIPRISGLKDAMVVCPDPIHIHRYYVGDQNYLVSIDFSAGGGYSEVGQITHIAGGGQAVEGGAEQIKISYLFCLSVPRGGGGGAVYFMDSSEDLRVVDLKTRRVKRVKTIGRVAAMCLDHSAPTTAAVTEPKSAASKTQSEPESEAPESGLLFGGMAVASRLDLDTGKVTAIAMRVVPPNPDDITDGGGLFLQGMACIAGGAVIASCTNTKRVYAGHIISANGGLRWDLIPITGVDEIHPLSLCVDEHNQCAYVCDEKTSHIRCVTLASNVFAPPP